MSQHAGRSHGPTLCRLACVLALCFGALAATGVQAQTAAGAAAVKPKASAKPSIAAKSTPRTAKATRPSGNAGTTGKTKAAAKGPVANKNVALGPDAVPALPKAFLSHGCLDSTHGLWLSEELGAAGDAWSRVGASYTALAAERLARPEALPAGEHGGVPEGSTPAEAALHDGSAAAAASAAGASASHAAPSACVHFASVRSPDNRIESLAVLPTGPLLQDTVRLDPLTANAPATATAADRPALPDAQRVMVVSRTDLGAVPHASWQDLVAPPAQREVWAQVSAVLGGELPEQVPARWQRDVSVLVRQMKKLAQASDGDWVRVVLQGDGERVAAVEIVEEASGQAVDSAIWLERSSGPGGFVSARGGDHERVLWQAPVDYRRISRGVGAATVFVRKRVMAKPKTPDGKPRMVVRTFRSRGQHQGVDFAAPTGTPVVTVAEGTVVHAGRNGGYGNLVIVDHGGGITTYYAHLSAFGTGIQEGARVERGQEIGLVGSTGQSTGPHLHYEIRQDGRYLDPADPAQTLPNWGLVAEEHRAVLTQLLSLSMSRAGAFSRAVRSPPALAAAPQTLPAE